MRFREAIIAISKKRIQQREVDENGWKKDEKPSSEHWTIVADSQLNELWISFNLYFSKISELRLVQKGEMESFSSAPLAHVHNCQCRLMLASEHACKFWHLNNSFINCWDTLLTFMVVGEWGVSFFWGGGWGAHMSFAATAISTSGIFVYPLLLSFLQGIQLGWVLYFRYI